MLNRRDFLKSMAAASAGVALAPGTVLASEKGAAAPAKPKGEKLKIAFVGIDTPESFTKSTPKYFQDKILRNKRLKKE